MDLIPRYPQLPAIMADVIILILKDIVYYMSVNIFFISTNFSVFIILNLNINLVLVLFQLQQILFTTAALSSVTNSNLIQKLSDIFFNQEAPCCSPYGPYSLLITNNKVILYCDLDIIYWLQLPVQHIIFFHLHDHYFRFLIELLDFPHDIPQYK